jgi:hypothetical protein
VSAADHALQNNADNEAAARQAADTTLQNNINNEISARAAADNALQTSLSSEVAARQAADNALQNNINNEAGARASADGVLQANLNNEAAARQAADTALQNNINSEAVARQLGDIGDVRADSASFYQSVPPGQEIPQVLGPVGDERESVSPSNPLEFLAVTRGKDAIGRRGFRWQAVPDEETGEARLELQYRKEDGSLATVLSINHDGTISFPPGQAFPIEARPGNGLGHGRDAVIEEQKRRIDALMREVQELRALLNDR